MARIQYAIIYYLEVFVFLRGIDFCCSRTLQERTLSNRKRKLKRVSFRYQPSLSSTRHFNCSIDSSCLVLVIEELSRYFGFVKWQHPINGSSWPWHWSCEISTWGCSVFLLSIKVLAWLFILHLINDDLNVARYETRKVPSHPFSTPIIILGSGGGWSLSPETWGTG